MKRALLVLVGLWGAIAVDVAMAQVNALGFFNFSNPQNLGSVAVGASTTFNDTLISNPGANTITALSLTGSDFQFSGTCASGLALAFTGTCSLNTRFTPSSPGAKSATLSVTCTPTPVIGGVSIICDGLAHTFQFIANGIGAVLTPASIPTLDRWVLSALAMLVMTWGVWHLWQRERSGRR